MNYGTKLYWLTQSATLLLMGLFGLELASRGLRPVEEGPVLVYLTLLSAYAGDKEISRWMSRRDPLQEAPAPRKGSWFVAAWAAAYFMLLALQAWQQDLRIPGLLPRCVMGVVGVFFGSSASKRAFGAWKAAGGLATARSPRSTPVRDDLKQRLEWWIQRRPAGASMGEISAAVPADRSSLLRALKDLEDGGRIRQEGETRAARYFPTN